MQHPVSNPSPLHGSDGSVKNFVHPLGELAQPGALHEDVAECLALPRNRQNAYHINRLEKRTSRARREAHRDSLPRLSAG